MFGNVNKSKIAPDATLGQVVIGINVHPAIRLAIRDPIKQR